MIRLSFTVNPNRSAFEIAEYEKNLIQTRLFAGCEIFFPYNVKETQAISYQTALLSYLQYDHFEMVLHLPYGAANNLATLSNLPAVIDRLYQAIDFANLFKIKKLTLHPGELDGTMPLEAALNLACENIANLCDYASKYQMIIMIENLVGENELAKTPEDMRFIVQKVNRPNCKITFDCAHYHASYQKDKKVDKSVIAFFEILKDDIGHLHISDNDGSTDAHGKIGSGTINFSEYLQTLNKNNYRGLCSSEVLFNDYHDLINTLKEVRELERVNE